MAAIDNAAQEAKENTPKYTQEYNGNEVSFLAGIARLTVIWNAQGMLSRIVCDTSPQPRQSSSAWAPGPIAELVDQLQEFFKSGRPLSVFPWEWLDQSEWSPFQRDVFAFVSRIPHGETRTYGWAAKKLGKPAASRAVGQALRGNPLPIFIPCHRIVGADSLGGFMGSADPNDPEIFFKKRLLSLEQNYQNPSFSFMPALFGASLAGPSQGLSA